MTFTNDYQQIVYTHCEQKKKESAGCRIYTAYFKNNIWDKAQEMVLVQDSSVSLGHPSMTADGLTMYFASDLEGGQGGKDIWKVTRKTPTDFWSKPENLGPVVNTPGEEMFPYIHADSTLYFASNYHPGLGGLDIFHYAPNKEGVWVVTNMKNPINSAQDDFGITFDQTGLAGYFSSTRNGKSSDDIFSFEIPVIKFSVVGIVVSEADNKPIEGATVSMTGSDGSTLEAVTGKDGKFSFALAAETSYAFISSKDDYFKGTANETTKGLTESKVLQVRIPMQLIKKEVAFEVENIFYDLDKASLRPESMVSLDKLVEFLQFNTNITIELGAHTDFRGSDKYNLDLSQRRAQSVVDYLTQKGINIKRLVAKGYGETTPRVITEKLAKLHPEFKVGDLLDMNYINALSTDAVKEEAHQINRRTEFKVLATDYKIEGVKFGNE
jgi:peptidoglycan-associated lipoprotein